MPIFDYVCHSCGFRAEVMRKISNSSQQETCPSCAQDTFYKQLSAPNFQLNGTGYYATDFKQSSPPPSADKTVTDQKAEKETTSPCGSACACH